MYNSKIENLIERLAEIDAISEQVGMNYNDFQDAIDLINDDMMDEFSYTFSLEDKKHHLYVNIEKICTETKQIRKYALGIQEIEERANVLRYDDAPHHNEVRKIKELNPPHHKHIGKEERVEPSSGDLDDIISGLEEKLEYIK